MDIVDKKIIDFIDNQNWRFATTYANSHPHEYLVKRLCEDKEGFDALCNEIKNKGVQQYFFRNKYIYLTIGDYTYWAMGNIINRRWNKIYYVNENGQVCKIDNWKEVLEEIRKNG